MAKLSRSLATIAVLVVAGGAAYLTRDRWQGYAPQWLAAYLPPLDTAHAPQTGGRQASGGESARQGGGGRQGGGVAAGAAAASIPARSRC